MPPAALAGRSKRSALVTWALRALVACALAIVVLLDVLPSAGLYRTVTVLSGSMRPTFSAGDLLVLRPEPVQRLRVGQMLTYRIPVGDRHLETHRVVRILRGGAEPIVQTKGDANAGRDPWTATLHGKTAWTVTWVIPGVGRVLLWLEQPLFKLGLLLCVLALVLVKALARVWTPPRLTDVATLPGRGTSDDHDVLAA